MKILVTGSSGYIAGYLIPSLISAGHYVVGIDRVANSQNIVSSFIKADLTDRPTYEDHIQDVDYICHLAAAKGDWGISDDEYYKDNVLATEALIKVSKHNSNLKGWINYSTVSVHGPSDLPVKESGELNPINAYGRTKLTAENMLEEYSRVAKVPIVSIRPSVVFGPNNPPNTNIYRLIEALRKGRFVMIGKGETIKSTSYIENLISANIFLLNRLMKNSFNGHQAFCYVDDEISTANLVGMLCDELSLRRPKYYLPLFWASSLAYVMDALGNILGVDFPITSARINKFCTPTRFSPQALFGLGFVRPVDLDVAINKTVKWHQAQLKMKKG